MFWRRENGADGEVGYKLSVIVTCGWIDMNCREEVIRAYAIQAGTNAEQLELHDRERAAASVLSSCENHA